MKSSDIPADLQSLLGKEPLDFVIKSKGYTINREELRGVIYGLIIYTFIFYVLGIKILTPLFQYGEVSFERGSYNLGFETVTASWENPGPIIFPVLFLTIIGVASIIPFVSSLLSLFQKRGYFVGTPYYLIHYRSEKEDKVYDWSTFAKVSKTTNKHGRGNVRLISKDKAARTNFDGDFPPKVLKMNGTFDVSKVEAFCRKRIEEHKTF